MTLTEAFSKNFLGNSPPWYKAAIVAFLIVNPIVMFAGGAHGPIIAGWLLLIEFIFTLPVLVLLVVISGIEPSWIWLAGIPLLIAVQLALLCTIAALLRLQRPQHGAEHRAGKSAGEHGEHAWIEASDRARLGAQLEGFRCLLGW